MNSSDPIPGLQENAVRGSSKPRRSSSRAGSADRPAKRRRKHSYEAASEIYDSPNNVENAEDGEAENEDLDIDRFLSAVRDEAQEACERIELKTFLEIWMFSLRNQAQTYLDLLESTLGWIGNNGPRASIQDWHKQLSICRETTIEADKIYQAKWQRLLDGADRQYRINPRRLLRGFGWEEENVVTLNSDSGARSPQ